MSRIRIAYRNSPFRISIRTIWSPSAGSCSWTSAVPSSPSSRPGTAARSSSRLANDCIPAPLPPTFGFTSNGYASPSAAPGAAAGSSITRVRGCARPRRASRDARRGHRSAVASFCEVSSSGRGRAGDRYVPAVQPERQHHNVTLAILTMAGIALALQQTMVIPALPALQRELHTTTTWVTWVLTVFLLVASVATPILGKLGDQYGKERLLVMS